MCSIRDPADGSSTVDDNATLTYMQNTFLAHYNGNRQPFGLYTHPIHTAVRSNCPLRLLFLIVLSRPRILAFRYRILPST